MKLRCWMGIGVAAALAMFTGSTLRAQDHDKDRDKHDHHWDKKDPRFDDHERDEARRWYGERHGDRPRGFRDEDRLPAGWEDHLRAGFVFDRDWRARSYDVPSELLVRLPPPPRHYRYVVVGGHVVLIDSGGRVHD